MTTAEATLSDFIVAEVHRQATDEAIRAKVTEHIDKTINEAIRSAFSYGDANKQITKAVQDSLAIEGRLDLPSFGNTIMALLRRKLHETVNAHVAARLDEEMTQILQLAPKEVKLSEVVKQMVDDLDQHDRYGTSVTCIVEESEFSAGYFQVYLDEEEDKPKWQCDTRLHVDREGRVFHLVMDQKDAKSTLRMGAYGWKKPIFTAYCCASKFIIDEDFVSTGVGDF